MDAYGVQFPGIPALMIGLNQTLAWGVTALWSGLHWRRLRASHATPFSQTAAVLRDDAIGLSALWTGRQRTGQQP